METSLTIPQNPTYPPSMDFQRLRQEGIRHIERLGSAIWTDYNLHDPGITILEVLCYALTDLGYRVNLPASDLFATEPGQHPFPTAAEILPTGPVTALDVRKLIIDLPGVHNAWVAARQTPDVLVQVTFPLTIKTQNSPDGKPIDTDEEKSYADAFAQLSETTRQRLIADLKTVSFTDLTVMVRPTTVSTPETIPLTTCLTNWYASLADCQPDLAKKHEIAFYQGLVSQLFTPAFPVPFDPDALADDEQAALQEVASQPLIQKLVAQLLLNNIGPFVEPDTVPNYTLYKPQGIYKLYVELDEDCDETEIGAAILERLHAHRNLGEDFDPTIEFLEKQPIAICANIQLTPDAQPDEVLPLIYQAIGEYLSPTLRFYTLEEMMNRHAVFTLTDATLTRLTAAQLPPAAQTALQLLLNQPFLGKATLLAAIRQALGDPDLLADYETLIFYYTDKRYDADPVYRGPLLTYGFLDEAELEAAQLRQTVYKSDIYQRLVQVPGVVAIQNLVMDRCYHEEGPDGRQGIQHDNWCLSCGCSCQYALDVDCSQFSFTRGISYVRADAQLARERYEEIRAGNTPIDQRGLLDLPLPAGHFRDTLTEYTSIQEDFPLTYHVGREGIVRTESPRRQAQVKQLKAYLLFYDQLLANYVAHLGEVRHLLAIDASAQPGKPYQVPDVPGLRTLLKQADPDGYETALSQLVLGNPVDQQTARNRIVDHLLARFGEQFTDYALQYFPIEKPAEDNPYGNLTDWIAQKQLFLRDVPALGNQRAGGFNYRATPQLDNLHVWKSPNVAGLERRVRARLGMAQSPLDRMPLAGEADPEQNPPYDWTRHPIAPESGFVPETFSVQINKRPRFRFGVKAAADDVDYVLVSADYFAKYETAETFGQSFLNLATDDSLYKLVEKPPQSNNWVVEFRADAASGTELVMQSPLAFSRLDEARQQLERIQALAKGQGQNDSFHLVEHLLLRPRDVDYVRLQASAVPRVPPLARLDPYSFQCTVVVPNWVKRFSDVQLLAQFEQTLRLEAPAHLLPSICRYSREQMRTFEGKYLDWLIVSSQPKPEPADLREVTNALVTVLNDNRATSTPAPAQSLSKPDCFTPKNR